VFSWLACDFCISDKIVFFFNWSGSTWQMTGACLHYSWCQCTGPWSQYVWQRSSVPAAVDCAVVFCSCSETAIYILIYCQNTVSHWKAAIHCPLCVSCNSCMWAVSIRAAMGTRKRGTCPPPGKYKGWICVICNILILRKRIKIVAIVMFNRVKIYLNAFAARAQPRPR